MIKLNKMFIEKDKSKLFTIVKDIERSITKGLVEFSIKDGISALDYFDGYDYKALLNISIVEFISDDDKYNNPTIISLWDEENSLYNPLYICFEGSDYRKINKVYNMIQSSTIEYMKLFTERYNVFLSGDEKYDDFITRGWILDIEPIVLSILKDNFKIVYSYRSGGKF